MVCAPAPDPVRGLIFFFAKWREPIFNTNCAFCMMHGDEVTYRSVVMLCLRYTSAYSQQIQLLGNTIFADLWQRRLIQI